MTEKKLKKKIFRSIDLKIRMKTQRKILAKNSDEKYEKQKKLSLILLNNLYYVFYFLVNQAFIPRDKNIQMNINKKHEKHYKIEIK